MTMVDRLIDQLRKRGLSVEPGDQPGQLKLTGQTKGVDDATMRALKLFKAQLLERVSPKVELAPSDGARHADSQPEGRGEPDPLPETAAQLCRLCSRDISDPQDREVLAANHLLCDNSRCPLKGGRR